MARLRTHLTAIATGLVVALVGASAALADPLELNPNNNGLDTICTAGCGGSYPFLTNNSTTAFTANLQIDGTPGSAGTQTATETGSVLIETFNVLSPIGGSSNVTVNYNIYATFTITGTGTWTGNQFNITAVNPALTGVTVWGSPGNNSTSGLNFSTPGSGAFGVTPGSHDLALGTAAFLFALTTPNAGGTCLGAANCSGAGATNFNGVFNFLPGAGTGPNGFFVNVTGPMQLTIGANEGGNGLNTTETVFNGTTSFITSVPGGGCTGTGFTGNCPGGGGSFSYDVNLPEPASLSLLGLALFGMGFMIPWRRNRKV